jgi:glycosyltransferase involved in cell wall biosynthesis
MISVKPRITVVIPTRDRPTLLVRAVRSALQQTFRDIEVLVVIDGEQGSETAESVVRLRDNRVRYILLPQQVGGSEARNIGVREARADWIAFLDDDDEWLPTKLAQQMAAAEDHTSQEQIVVTCQHLHRQRNAADVIRPRRLPRPDEAACEFMFDYLCYFQTSTFLCSKRLMLDVPFTKGLPFFQDIDWFLRALHDPETKLVVVTQPLSIYNAPEDRVTVTSTLGWRARVGWGRANRHLMSKRAYSRFIVGSCVGRAVQDRAGVRGFGRLFYECAIVGSPTPQLLLMLCGTYALRPSLRKKLRDRLLLRRMDRQVALEPSHHAKVA